MEKNKKTSLNDKLISPTRLMQQKIVQKVKVIPSHDGLVERASPKMITLDGKELINEVNKGIIL